MNLSVVRETRRKKNYFTHLIARVRQSVECIQTKIMSNLQSVDDVRLALQHFAWPDYLMFLLMLSICAVIGIYFGFFEKKSKQVADETDYLVGGRNMKIFPVAMSLIAR